MALAALKAALAAIWWWSTPSGKWKQTSCIGFCFPPLTDHRRLRICSANQVRVGGRQREKRGFAGAGVDRLSLCYPWPMPRRMVCANKCDPYACLGRSCHVSNAQPGRQSLRYFRR
ncbi:hypothetical protein B0T22DRAFT_459886 [Podospora appendiculata]|uniref:Secreted protein n=1 Tax=Podospora appendiculata TaxID=314037 RepID=A0AAE0X9L3_9PEZI|nr:hypothetical protein B0T22DRAFT_459886 [Podospora appendiculata]